MDPQHCFQADLIWCDGTFKTLFWSMIKSIDYPSYLTISKRIHAIKNLLCLLILFDIPFCVLLFSERLLATSHWPEDINGERSFRGQIPSFAPVGSGVERLQGRRRLWFQAVFRIRIRIHRIHLFLGLPDPDPLVRGMDPDPDPALDPDPDPSIIKQI